MGNKSTKQIIKKGIQAGKTNPENLKDRTNSLNPQIKSKMKNPSPKIRQKNQISEESKIKLNTQNSKLCSNSQDEILTRPKTINVQKCPICQESLNNSMIRTISCKHTFCVNCINHALSYFPLCPICRSIIEDTGFVKHDAFISRCKTNQCKRTEIISLGNWNIFAVRNIFSIDDYFEENGINKFHSKKYSDNEYFLNMRIKIMNDPFFRNFHSALRNDSYFKNSEFLNRKLSDKVDAPAIVI